MAKFAEELSKHTDAADIEAGRGTVLNPGGRVAEVCERLGLTPKEGAAMLQRLKRDLGGQAK